MPSRRELLAASTSPLVLGGCLGGITGDDSDLVEDGELTIPESAEDYPVNEGGYHYDFQPGGEHETIALGSREGISDDYRPHLIRVMNFAPAPEIGIGIIDMLATEIIHDELYEIPAEEEVKVDLLAPSKYLVAVWITESGDEHTVRVECNKFDCNGSSTRIGVFNKFLGYEIASTVFSTAVGCPGYSC